MGEPYRTNHVWRKTTRKLRLSLAELFIFADKYSIPQLRDDVTTAFVGQCWKRDAFPAQNDNTLILLMATNLPASSRVKEFVAFCIAWAGILHSDKNPENIMRSLQKLDPNLAFEVGITYAVKAHDCIAKSGQMSAFLSDHLPNACVLHDHTHLDQDQCRKRIASQLHVFTAILDACAKAVMTKPAEKD